MLNDIINNNKNFKDISVQIFPYLMIFRSSDNVCLLITASSHIVWYSVLPSSLNNTLFSDFSQCYIFNLLKVYLFENLIYAESTFPFNLFFLTPSVLSRHAWDSLLVIKFVLFNFLSFNGTEINYCIFIAIMVLLLQLLHYLLALHYHCYKNWIVLTWNWSFIFRNIFISWNSYCQVSKLFVYIFYYFSSMFYSFFDTGFSVFGIHFGSCRWCGSSGSSGYSSHQISSASSGQPAMKQITKNVNKQLMDRQM